MFIEEVKIKKTDWHYKLLKFVLGEKNIPTMNFCPYFWLTIFSMFVFSFVAIYKGLQFVTDKIADRIDYLILEPLTKIKFKKISQNEEDLYYAILAYYDLDLTNQEYTRDHDNIKLLGYSQFKYQIGNRRKELKKIYDFWIKNFEGDIEQYIQKLKEKKETRIKELMSLYEKMEEDQKKILIEVENKKNINKTKRKNKINAIIKYTKIFTPILGTVFGVFIACYLFKALIWLIFSINWLSLVIGIGFMISIILLVITFIYIINFFIKIFKIKKRPYNQPSKLKRCIQSIGEFFKFFIDFFKIWKSNNCPAIVWDDEKKINLEK